jgi:UDP:flavonoid glycosyltransferase YjiC (YdhE family)
MRSLARTLVERGHEVVAYTGKRYGDGFSAAGARLLTWQHAPDFDDSDLRATFPEVTDGRGPRAVTANLEHVFLRTGAGQARDILEAGPFDVLVSDQLAIGSTLASELSGTPVASVAITPLVLPSRDLPPQGMALRPMRGPVGRTRDAVLRTVTGALLARLDRVLGEVRGSLGLASSAVGALDAFYSSQLVIAHGVPELEYPRSDLPPQVHFVGQLAPVPVGTTVPSWWDEVAAGDSRVVHVTQGTYDVDPRDLLLPALEGLADLDVRVAVATGGATPARGRGAAERAAGSVPPLRPLLPRTSVMVTNGGWGGVLASLAAGVPLVVAGGTLDKPEIARRVAWSGVGVDLRTGSRHQVGCVPPCSESSTTRPTPTGRRGGTVPGPARGGRRGRRPGGGLATSRLPVVRSGSPW